MMDMGPISYCLDIKIEKNREKSIIKLSQPSYIDKIAYKYRFLTTKLSNTSMQENFLVSNESQANAKIIKDYQAIVRFIMFAIVESHSDIAFAVSMVSRFAKNSNTAYVNAVKMIICYLNTTKSREITYGGSRNNFDLIEYSHSDWRRD